MLQDFTSNELKPLCRCRIILLLALCVFSGCALTSENIRSQALTEKETTKNEITHIDPAPPSQIDLVHPEREVFEQDAISLAVHTESSDSKASQSANTSVKLLSPDFDEAPAPGATIVQVGAQHSPLPPPPDSQISPSLHQTEEVNLDHLYVIPPNFSPWWTSNVTMPFRPEMQQSQVNVNTLIQEALIYSAQIRVISDDPVIAETAITQAMSEFDPKLFIESKFNRIDVPASSTLDTGTDFSRLRENDWNSNIGIRRKHSQGGELELSQQFGMNTSNSIFFVPPNQGDARLTLSFNQPLLNGRGQAYNESLIVLAELNTSVSSDRTQAALQDHLLSVTEAYWELYLNRVLFLQKQKHLQDGLQIQTYLEKRYNLDSLQSQIARARAAVARRRSEVIRAEAAVQNSETRLRSLINSPQLNSSPDLELISIQQPNDIRIPVTVEDAMATAMAYRTEVDIASQEIQAARVRLGVACNDLLPKLDLVLETYLTGLKGNFNISQAWADQFSVGAPSYTAGLVFEVPLGRQQAKSRHLQRTVELRRLLNKFELTVDNLRAEVEIAVRYVKTSDRNLQSQYQSLLAANADADYLKRRWELLPGHDRSSSFLLEDLIDAQDRRTDAEQAFVTAQVDHVLSRTKLNRSTGTILRQENSSIPVLLESFQEESDLQGPKL
tara:strand:- start:17534 stop:19543 length:2010 start_codon:yes stop_codon:yes gene_type:complete